MTDLYTLKDRAWDRVLADMSPANVQACADTIGQAAGLIPRDAIVWERELWELVMDEIAPLLPPKAQDLLEAALSTSPQLMGAFVCLDFQRSVNPHVN